MLLKPASLDEQWKKFVVKTGLTCVSKIQSREMEAAFKTGAMSILLEMRTKVADLSEDAAINTLGRWEEEYKIFIEARIEEWKGM